MTCSVDHAWMALNWLSIMREVAGSIPSLTNTCSPSLCPGNGCCSLSLECTKTVYMSQFPFMKLRNHFAFCYLENMLKEKSFKTSGSQFHKWHLGLSRNRPQDTKPWIIWVKFVCSLLYSKKVFSGTNPVIPSLDLSKKPNTSFDWIFSLPK